MGKRSSRKKLYSVRKGLRSGSMSQLSEPEYEQYGTYSCLIAYASVV